MARKRSVWTKAMRERAAAHGRRGGQQGGRVMWFTRTPEEREAILARLAGGRGHQANTSAKARAAQARRGRDGMRRLTAAKAALLADIGMLRKTLAAAEARLSPIESAGCPVRADYPDDWTFRCALQDWHRARHEGASKPARGGVRGTLQGP